MSIDDGRAVRRRTAGRLGLGWIAPVAVTVVALASAASASAASFTAVVAPIGTGSYVLSVQNTGPEPITSVVFSAGEKPTNIVPSSCTLGNTPVVNSISCAVSVASGGDLQVCWTGEPIEELLPGANLLVGNSFGSATTAPAVSSCPVAGFKGASNSSGGAKCVVPKLSGKTEAAAVKALSAAHCALGKVKKAKSSKIKKGKVISQGTASGKSLAGGSKIGLTISKGR
jgi:PASTA domain